jgi:hypothetical protein
MRRQAHYEIRADTVEKLRISDVVIFRKEPVIGKSHVISAMRRSELPHERQKTDLAKLPRLEKLVTPYGQKFRKRSRDNIVWLA